MTIRDMKGVVLDEIPVKNVLASVFFKDGLDELVPAIMEANPDARFFSSTGTYRKIKEILGPKAEEHLISVEYLTDCPEMEGGLVKTLQGGVHSRLLAERGNEDHMAYMENVGKKVKFLNSSIRSVYDAQAGGKYNVEIVHGVPLLHIDMLIGNLYPFSEKIKEEDVTFEGARGNIDIGGPAMIRAGAKNFMSCAVVTDPNDYGGLIAKIKKTGGTNFKQRFELMRKAFALTDAYDQAISGYMAEQNVDDVAAFYGVGGE